jgi:hypothetical protein
MNGCLGSPRKQIIYILSKVKLLRYPAHYFEIIYLKIRNIYKNILLYDIYLK